jgi:hypothetical protein
MSAESSIAPLKRLLRFPFQEPQWQGKVVVGAALTLAGSIIPIVPTIFVWGYFVRVMRGVIAGQAPSLPPWDEWGDLFRDGLSAFAIGLVYFLPAMLVWLIGMGLYFAATFYLPFAAMSSADETEIIAQFMAITFGSMAVMFLAMALGTLLMVLGAIALPLATAHFVAEERLGAAFRLRQWWRILKADRWGYLAAWVVFAGIVAILYVAMLVLYSTLILCVLIPIVAAPIGFYLSLVGAALFGEVYRDSAAALPESTEARAAEMENAED